MLTRRHFTGSAVAASAAFSQVAQASSSTDVPARRSEVTALRAFAEKTHPRGREAAADPDWRSRWDRLSATADSISDGAYFIALRRGLGWFADGHTTVLPFDSGNLSDVMKAGPFGQSLPLRARVFGDGIYITATGAEYRALLGQRVERVGSLTTAELIRAHAIDWPGNKAWAHRWAALPINSPALLQGFGAIAGTAAPIPFVIGGSAVTIQARIGEFSDRVDIERKLIEQEQWAKTAGGGNYVRPLLDRKAIYISIDDMDDVEGKTFVQLTRDVFAAMENPQADRVIIDLRRNGGGNNYWGEPLRKALAASRFNRPGGLYVLTSPVTFSAAQNLASRLERETFALFVGEPTGGAPNHYGDAALFRGDATGIQAIVSTIPWFDSYPQDKRPFILPDLPVPQLFADWRAGHDRALEAALAYRTSEAADFLSRDRAFFFSRPSQMAEWKPFWA